jgi:hypothetical protein
MSTQPPASNGTALERVRYFSGQLLTDGDMVADQHYFRQKLRRHNRFLHGWGVTCGCEVRADPADDRPWRVRVCPGYLVTPQGDEVLLGDAHFDLAGDWLQAQDACTPYPCPPTGTMPGPGRTEPVYLAVRYAECDTRPVRLHPLGCACDETACDYSRVRDSWELGLLWELPESHTKAMAADEAWLRELRLRSNGPFPVPPCAPYPDEPWVVLAAITLPATASQPIADAQIDLGVRRVLYSTTALHLLIEA